MHNAVPFCLNYSGRNDLLVSVSGLISINLFNDTDLTIYGLLLYLKRHMPKGLHFSVISQKIIFWKQRESGQK